MFRRLRFAARPALAGLLVAAAAAGQNGGGTAGAVLAGSSSSGVAQGHQFQISGQVGGLYPGANRPLVLTLFNPNKASITVTSITTAVGDASSACPGTFLRVAPFSGSLVVGPNQSASTTVTAIMLQGAPDACQGAVFPLTFSGQGQAL